MARKGAQQREAAEDRGGSGRRGGVSRRRGAWQAARRAGQAHHPVPISRLDSHPCDAGAHRRRHARRGTPAGRLGDSRVRLLQPPTACGCSGATSSRFGTLAATQHCSLLSWLPETAQSVGKSPQREPCSPGRQLLQHGEQQLLGEVRPAHGSCSKGGWPGEAARTSRGSGRCRTWQAAGIACAA